MATSNGSLRMSKKGQTRGNRQDRRAKVPCCQHTVVCRRLRRVDWLAATVIATEIFAEAGFHH
jgi:hypothetical protein